MGSILFSKQDNFPALPLRRRPGYPVQIKKTQHFEWVTVSVSYQMKQKEHIRILIKIFSNSKIWDNFIIMKFQKFYLDDLSRSQLKAQQLVLVNVWVKHLESWRTNKNHMHFPTLERFWTLLHTLHKLLWFLMYYFPSCYLPKLTQNRKQSMARISSLLHSTISWSEWQLETDFKIASSLMVSTGLVQLKHYTNRTV